MRVNWILGGFLGLVMITGLRADLVDISVENPRREYLLFEPLLLRVTLANNSGQDLVFQNTDTGESWLDFIVTNDSNQSTAPKDHPAGFSKIFVAAGESKSIAANVTPLYDIRDTGSYHIQVVVRVAGREYVTSPLGVTIVNGMTLFKTDRNVDGATLTYTVLRFSPSTDSAFFYLRVEDATENVVYTTMRLGPVGSFKDPTVLFDNDNNLHILHSIGQSVYRYTRVNPKGQMLSRDQFIAVNESLPELVTTKDGSVIVLGGKKDDPANRRELLSTAQTLIRKAPEKPLPMAPVSAPNAEPQSPPSAAAN